MKRKKHHYTVMSDRRCKCGKLIKLNVVERKPHTVRQCYKCHKSMMSAWRGRQPHQLMLVPQDFAC